MSKKRPNKQTCVDLIADEIDKGLRYTDVWETLGNFWGISNPTFDKYWKEASVIAEGNRKAINDAKMNVAIKHEEERAKQDLLKRDEALEILAEIAKRQEMNNEGLTVNDSNRIRAIDQISKMEAWLAPTKIEQKTDISINDDELYDSIMDRVKKLKNGK